MLATKLTNETWRSERRGEDKERERQEEEEGRKKRRRSVNVYPNAVTDGEMESFIISPQRRRPAEENKAIRASW